MAATYTTRDEAILREVTEPLGESAAEHDIAAIADEVLGDYSEGYVCKVTPEEFWVIAEKHARTLPAGANAIYTNADGSHELVELDEIDTVTRVVAALTEEQHLAIFAGETEYKAVGHDVEVGDGDTFVRIEED